MSKKQMFAFEIGCRVYTAELWDQFRRAGRPIDRYEVRLVNDEGDREFFGMVDCPRRATVTQRRNQIASEIGIHAA